MIVNLASILKFTRARDQRMDQIITHHKATRLGKLNRQLQRVWRASLDLMLPNHCLLCASPCPHPLCCDCEQQLPHLQHHCHHCALPLPQPGICGDCLSREPAFDTCLCAYEYAGLLPRLINHFKHHGHTGVGRQLNLALRNRANRKPLPDVFTPVPLHWRGLMTRGFNQAEVLSQQLASELGVTHQCLVKKPSATPHQQQLNRRQRLGNARRAFAIAGVCDDLHVGLVDDVVTTGATVDAISQLLKAAGARTVTVYALARTPS